MFAIFKNGKKTVRKTFGSYDDARCHVRKLIRKTNDWYGIIGAAYNNPNLTEYGYNIRKV